MMPVQITQSKPWVHTKVSKKIGLRLSDKISQFLRRWALSLKGYCVQFSPALFWNIYTFFNRGYFEKEVCLLNQLCNKNKISIDIGANYGGYLNEMRKHSGLCIGFEPIPKLANFLQKGFEYTNSRIMNCALSNYCGTTYLRHPIYHPGYTTIEPSNNLEGKIRHDQEILFTKTSVRTLDSYNFKSVGFIKIDVEGHEIEVLRGAAKTLSESYPNILIEIEERHRRGSVQEVRQFLKDLGYLGYYFKNGNLVPMTFFDVAHQQNPMRPKDYIRNFIFIRSEFND